MTLTGEQSRAVTTLGEHLCVDAGAGSGKTRVLVGRIVHILAERKAELSEIVAITFTRKAAAEMKERLREAFHQKAPLDNPDEMTYWRDLERRIESARVSTIDSFCTSLLKENALALAIDPDFSMLADAESTLFRAKIVSESLLRLLDSGDEAALRVATEHGIGTVSEALESMLMQANVLERVAREHPLEDAEALAEHWAKVVGTEEDSRLERLPKSFSLEQFRGELADFEGECIKVADGREQMRQEMLRLLGAIVASESANEIRGHVTAVIDLKVGSTRKTNWSSEEVHARLKSVQDALKDYFRDYLPISLDPDVETEAAELAVCFYGLYSKVEERYKAAKLARACMDFSDLMTLSVRMLQESDALRVRTASGIKYLLIDEFQDTNAEQLALAKSLMKSAAEAGAELFVVGDPKQSIYKFRGAEVEVFDEARRLAAETIPLDANFRTLPNVMEFINDFFRRSRALEEVEPDYAGMEAMRGATEEARVEILVPEEVDGANRETEREMEAELIADRIAEMCGPDGASVVDSDSGDARPAAFGDVAILFRVSSHIQTYAQALQARGVNYNIVEGTGFYKKQEISDFRNLLQTVLDPWDEMALVGFLRSPIAALKDETLMELCLERGLSDAFASDAAVGDPDQNERLSDARELIETLRARVEMPLQGFLRQALIETSYEAILIAGHHGVQKASNVRKLVDVAAEFAHTGPASLRTFTRYLDELGASVTREGEAELYAGSGGAVKLMTVHKSKGLEFPIVVLADTAQGTGGRESSAPFSLHRRLGLSAKSIGPDGESRSPGLGTLMNLVRKDEDRAEEARILYVAMTRARDWLLIGGSRKPGKGSWFRLLNDVYGLSERRDGDTVTGDGWEATVRRRPGQGPKRIRDSKAQSSETVDSLLERAEAFDGSLARQEDISISALLDLICDDGHDEATWSHVDAGQEFDPMLRGTMIHRLLELWNFAASETPSVDRIVADSSPGIRARTSYTTELSEAATRIKESEYFSVLRDAGEIRKEVPFLFRLGDSTISGTIDALLPDGTIVDYKTGEKSPESHDRHALQLRLYAAALAAIEGSTPSKAVLFYVDSGETVEVDLGAPQIEKALADAREALEAALNKTPSP